MQAEVGGGTSKTSATFERKTKKNKAEKNEDEKKQNKTAV